MTTQAIISLVKKGHTFIKIISGCRDITHCNWQKIIRENRVNNLQDIYDLALKTKFGCEDLPSRNGQR